MLACRNPARAEQAADRLRLASPRASIATVELDLASLASVRAAADQLRSAWPRLDLLVNNAGVMEVPYERTEDGFELTFAINHLGHFALTGLLLPCLLATPGSRVVTMSSQGHAEGVMNFGDLQYDSGYEPATAYFQSKLANLLFSYELDRRLRAARRSHCRGGRPSRRRAHRPVPHPLEAGPAPHQPADATDQLLVRAERPDGSAASTARGHRSGRPRRRLLRAAPALRHGLPCQGGVQRPVA